VKVCGLTFADRIAYQEDGQPMKFVSLCDYTGFVETELFATVYKAFGMETIKGSPIIEVEGFVEPPFQENKKGGPAWPSTQTFKTVCLDAVLPVPNRETPRGYGNAGESSWPTWMTSWAGSPKAGITRLRSGMRACFIHAIF
jgi:hypothetical protein